MDLYYRYLYGAYRIPYRDARMRVCGGIYYYRAVLFPGIAYKVYDLPFVVRLNYRKRNLLRLSDLFQFIVDILYGNLAVNIDLTFTQKI
jgi:hypothetical protein